MVTTDVIHLIAEVFSVKLNVNFMWKPEPIPAKRSPALFGV